MIFDTLGDFANRQVLLACRFAFFCLTAFRPRTG